MAHAGTTGLTLTARAAGLVACHRCGKVHRTGADSCARCGGRLVSRHPRSLQRVWAWLVAGFIAYIPANLYPMLRTSTFGTDRQSTIIGGVIELFEHGSWGVALIIFAASVVIPVGKFLVIGYLALSTGRADPDGAATRLHLYEMVEFIGRWSMIDVFVVAILSALVQLDFIASIHPGPAAACFALSVAFTMLAAQAFDPRTIWDTAGREARQG